MPNGDGHESTLGVELRPDHVVLVVEGRRRALDPATSVQLALTLTHWLLDRVIHGFKISPIVIPTRGE